MAEKPTANGSDDDDDDDNKSCPLSGTDATTDAQGPPQSHQLRQQQEEEDTLKSELNFVTDDEDNQLICNLEPTIEYQPNLNLIETLANDSLEETTPTAGQLEDTHMYGGLFDDTFYPSNTNHGYAAATVHRMSIQAQQQQQPAESVTILERQLTNPKPYWWWVSPGLNTSANRNYSMGDQSGMTSSAMSALAPPPPPPAPPQRFESSPLCHGLGDPISSTVPDYGPYSSSSSSNTNTFMLEEPHSALTATMTYAEIPRIKMETYYGGGGMSPAATIVRQTPRSHLYPLVNMSNYPPPPPYGAYHSTTMHNTASSVGYSTDHSHYSMDRGMNACSSLPFGDYSMVAASPANNTSDLQSHYHYQQQEQHDQRPSVATNRFQNVVGDGSFKERCRASSIDQYLSPSTTVAMSSRPSASLQNCPQTHSSGMTESQLWINNYRSTCTVPNCTNTTTTASNYSYPPPPVSTVKDYRKVTSGEAQSNNLSSKEAFGHNVEAVHSTLASSSSNQELPSTNVGCRGANTMLASVLDRLESANCLLDLSKQTQLLPSSSGGFTDRSVAGLSASAIETPVTATVTQASLATISSCGMRPSVAANPSPPASSLVQQTLPSFSSQFGNSCSTCCDPKKRKHSTVREMLQEKSKLKIMALIQPVTLATAIPTMSRPTPIANKLPEEPKTISTSGMYPISSSAWPTMLTTALRSPRSTNPPPYYKPEIRFPVPLANRNPGPLRPQSIPVVFVQSVPQPSCNNKQMVSNWQVMLRSPSVHQDVVSMPMMETRSAAAKLSEPTNPCRSLLYDSQCGTERQAPRAATHGSQSAMISMPILIPMEKEKSTECIVSLLASNNSHPNKAVPPESPKGHTPPNNKQQIKIESLNFRPQHHEMDFLQIGSFIVTKSPGPKNLNKFKILFSKRKFIYEFQANNVRLPAHNRSVQHSATIEVPFAIVNAIHCNEQEILIAVTQTPDLFLFCKRGKLDGVGCESHFERGRKTDITGGMLRTNHLHKIYLRKCQAEMLRTVLETFDPSFKLKMQTPILEVVEISNVVTTSNRSGLQSKRQCEMDVIQPVAKCTSTSKENTPVRIVCHCQVSCRSNRCSCMKTRIKCGRGSSKCSCKNCDNPLNILDKMGFSTEDCAADICLVHNIVSYKGDLEELLDRKVKFPCCDREVPVKNCIPGKVNCPNDMCNGVFKFSWCDFELQDEEKEPRNHCSMCRSCQGCVDLHCTACRRCNPMQTKGSKCPDCNNLRDTTFTEIRDIADVLLLLANDGEQPQLLDENEEEEEEEEEADGGQQHKTRILDSGSVNVEVVNIEDSEDIDAVRLQSDDVVNEIEIETDSESENDDPEMSEESEGVRRSGSAVEEEEEGATGSSPALSTLVEDETED